MRYFCLVGISVGSLLVLSGIGSVTWGAEGGDLFVAQHCSTDLYGTTCTDERGDNQKELTIALDAIIAKKFAHMSTNRKEKRFTEIIGRIEDALPVIESQAFVCRSGSDTCEVRSRKYMKIYMLYTLIYLYLQDKLPVMIEETDGYQLRRQHGIFFVVPQGKTDWLFEMPGTTAKSWKERHPACSIINAGYFGRYETSAYTIYQPAGDIVFVQEGDDWQVTIPSINEQFRSDRNLQLPISYDTSNNQVTFADQVADIQFYAGPVIIDEGKLVDETRTTYSHYQLLKARTFLVRSEGGDPIWGFAPSPMTLTTLGDKLMDSSMFDGAFSVVNLDGGSSTSFAGEYTSFNANKQLPWFFTFCPTSKTQQTQRDAFDIAVRDAIDAYMRGLQADSYDDKVLGGRRVNEIELISPWLPQLTSAQISVRMDLFMTIPYQWSCGYAMHDGANVGACEMSIDLEKSGDDRSISEVSYLSSVE